ncbi:MAG: hypothetical protein OHK0017_08560 [Patescibacteria group bacterium]
MSIVQLSHFNGKLIQEYLHNLNGAISPRSLVFPFVDSEHIILGTKKRGFGVGYLNGFGGKLEPGETYYESAARELLEELGVRTVKLDFIGQINFYFPLDFPISKRAQQVMVFKCSEFEGEPTETEEMSFEIINLNTIPFNRMWPDAPLYFPIINQKNWKAEILYDSNYNVIDAIVAT